MDGVVEVIQIEIPRELFENKVTNLIDELLKLDELLNREETPENEATKEAA